MKKFTVTLDRRNERKTITVEAMSFPGARNSAREQFPDWDIWLVRESSPSPLAEAIEIARGAPPISPVRFSADCRGEFDSSGQITRAWYLTSHGAQGCTVTGPYPTAATAAAAAGAAFDEAGSWRLPCNYSMTQDEAGLKKLGKHTVYAP